MKKLFWTIGFAVYFMGNVQSAHALSYSCVPNADCSTTLSQGLELIAYQGSTLPGTRMYINGTIEGTAVCDVYQNNGAQAFFVPTKTLAEYQSFRTAVINGNGSSFLGQVAHFNCGCGDGICAGGSIEGCGPDDSLAPNAQGNPSCASDCGTVCPPIAGDGYCANTVDEHCGPDNTLPNSLTDCGTCACGSPFYDCTGQCGSCGSCSPCCGDNNLDAGEQCDGTDLGSQTCAGLGYAGGTLACAGNCLYDTSGCTVSSCINTYCGNGTCDAGETNCTCPSDCPATTCGDGCCAGSETCATTAGTNINNGECDNDCQTCGPVWTVTFSGTQCVFGFAPPSPSPCVVLPGSPCSPVGAGCFSGTCYTYGGAWGCCSGTVFQCAAP